MTLKEILQNAGIAGAGGAGFPAYAKQAPGADVFVVNGAECEPLLYTDFTLIRLFLPQIGAGADAVVEAAGMKRAVLGIEKEKAKKLSLTEGQSIGKYTKIHLLPDAYPIGDEISLIYETTGRVVTPGKLPITAGVIVGNVESVLQMYAALTEGKPVTDKWLTVAGAVKEPTVLRVPLGTPVKDILSYLHIEIPEGYMLMDGGPAMGRKIQPETAVVKKTTKALTLISPDTEAALQRMRGEQSHKGLASTACCQCTRCTDLCPRFLLGYPLQPHLMVRAASYPNPNLELLKTATLCCGCGICETVACSQGISPKSIIAGYKAKLRQENMAFTPTPDRDYAPLDMRAYRKVPGARYATLLGVGNYHRIPSKIDTDFVARSVSIPLSGHIGAPSVACVSVGDKVEKGQVIATPATGLSLPQHASITGRVSSVTKDDITIENIERKAE